MGLNLKMNKYQTVFTDEDFKNLPKEVKSEFYDLIENVPFIKWLTQPEEIRGFAKDRPIDTSYNNKRILVDVTKPHILEDMDYFRERAIFHQKHGRYTDIPPNPNPKSEWSRFWKQEMRRWKYGYTRKSDGEWIPGSYYFYLNYSPIWQVKDVFNPRTGKSRGERYKEFPKVYLGDYLFFHYMEQALQSGSHVKMLKCRGIGASFKLASMSPRNMYIFPGTGNPNFHLASDSGFLTGDKGIWGKILDTLDWIADNTPLPRLRAVDRRRGVLEVQLGYDDKYGVRRGLQTSVTGISLKDNPDKARGLRGVLIHYEEDGLFPNLETAWNINRSAVEEGGTAFGLMVAAGTGGTEGADFAGSERLYYNPGAYNIYGVPNVYDKNSSGNTNVGFFWGSYLNRRGCFDPINGEPDVTKALVEILIGRAKIRASAPDSATITQNAAENALTPQEAVMRVDGTMFPVADLKEYLSEIVVNEMGFTGNHFIGELIWDGKGGVTFVSKENAYPIRDFPALENKTGAVEIFELPVPKKIDYRYIIGVDTYDDDVVEYSTSLGSAFVFDRWTRRIVAEFTGRPPSANAFYEIVHKLAVYYNATIMYESNKKGLFTYFNHKMALTWLADTPEIISDKQTLRPSATTNTSKGINATSAINSYGLRLQSDWMLENIYDAGTAGEDEEEVYVPNYRSIRSIGYLKEAIAWHSKINADRVSAMNMVMIYDAELEQYAFKRESASVARRSDDPIFDIPNHRENSYREWYQYFDI